MSEKDKIINIAINEIGYLEKSWAAYNENPEVIYDKVAGAGSDNVTKYAKEMDDLCVYNTPKNGYPWCKVFVDWLFVQAFGLDKAGELLHGWTAGVEQFYDWYNSNGQIYYHPEIGDLVIFGDCDHIGIITDFDDDTIYTIEGNTSADVECEANGGTVTQKSYSRYSSWINCYARPNYEIVKNQITIQAHVQNVGWMNPVGLGEVAGTTGRKLQLEAIILNSDNIDLEYRAHCSNLGWQDWVKNGEVAGTTGESRAIEAIEIKSSVPLKVSEHLQNIGWMPESKGNYILIGTVGKSLPMEALKMELL